MGLHFQLHCSCHWYVHVHVYIGCRGYREGESEVGGNCNVEHVHFSLPAPLALRVYSGHHSYLINTYDLEINPTLWLSVVSTHKIRDTYCSYAVIDTCCKDLGSSTDVLKVSGTSWVSTSPLRLLLPFPFCSFHMHLSHLHAHVHLYMYMYSCFYHSLLLPLPPPRPVALTSHV